MELLFKGKQNISEILKEAESYGKLDLEDDSSFVIFGDNFENLAKLYNTKKAFVDLVYIDPPFNTNQTFSVGESRVSTISRNKTGKIAYEDLMEKEDFLNFMYKRFVLIKELLSEKGSLYVHIDTKMGHYFKILLDEIFGAENFKNDITRVKSNPKNFSRKAYGNQKDVILFYAKKQNKNIWNDVRIDYNEEELAKSFKKVDSTGRRYTTIPLHAPGESNGITGQPWRGMMPPEGRHWRTNPEEFDRMDEQGLIEWSSTGNPRIKKFADEHKGKKIQDIWEFKDPQNPVYPTEKNLDLLDLIIKQSSNPDSVVMDCFAGSGTTLIASAKNNRKFIGMDKSEFAFEVIEEKLKDYSYKKFCN